MNAGRVAATGIVIFVAVMLAINGIWGIFVGIAAIAKGEFFVLGPNYVYEFSAVGWGWIHLILGILVLIVAVALLMGKEWARWPTVVLAGLQAIAQFFFLPYYPWWALLIIALDVIIIWALLTYHPEVP